MKVYAVFADYIHEGRDLHSLHADRGGAERERDELAARSRYIDYVVEEVDVKEKAPESSDPEASFNPDTTCFLCRRDFSKCRCLPL